MLRFITLALCILIPRLTSLDLRSPEASELVIWNVGQGLWTTWITPEACWHFDMGGERMPSRAISIACTKRDNLAQFSHWDWDHIGLARRARQSLVSICILTEPGGEGTPSRRRYLANALTPCGEPTAEERSQIEELHWRPSSSRSRSSNAMSRVFLVKTLALLPGDSIASEERLWSPALNGKRIRLLVLGHHGSRTSTSAALLKQLPHLRQAVASARRGRYGHPHKTVVDRLKKKGVAVVSTEDWGTLRWEVPQTSLTDYKGDIPCSSCERQARSKYNRRKH